MESFLSDGMGKYKLASATMVAFGKAIEHRLHEVLKTRAPDDWGSFVPEAPIAPRSTRYWSEYPLFNAKIDGALHGTAVQISIDVNWYEADGEYPFYCAWLKPHDQFIGGMNTFTWSDKVERVDRGIRLNPDPNDFNLESDLGVLLDDLVKFMNAHAPP